MLSLLSNLNNSSKSKSNAYFTGIRCSSQCPAGYYGEQCDHQCNCKNNSSCDPNSGDCICARGWTGADCSKPCPKGYYGKVSPSLKTFNLFQEL